jgi:hypothetical protein
MMLKLYKCFYMNDALLMEINPLILTKEGHYVAADSKVELDDDTRYRQKSLSLPERRDSTRKTTSLELLALKNDQRDTRGAAGRMFYEIPDGDIIVLASGLPSTAAIRPVKRSRDSPKLHCPIRARFTVSGLSGGVQTSQIFMRHSSMESWPESGKQRISTNVFPLLSDVRV